MFVSVTDIIMIFAIQSESDIFSIVNRIKNDWKLGEDGINNLMSIYSCCTGKSYEEIENEFAGKGYGDFKLAVGESVVDVLKPLQDRVAELSKDKAYIDSIIKNNGERANYVATKTLRKVQKKIGFPERIR